jgi:dihydrofolate reductase
LYHRQVQLRLHELNRKAAHLIATKVRRLQVLAEIRQPEDPIDLFARYKGLILSGSSTLTSALLEHGLADEVLLVVYPVLLGTGKRLFAEGTPARSFELVGTQAMPSGVILSRYTVAGPLKTG